MTCKIIKSVGLVWAVSMYVKKTKKFKKQLNFVAIAPTHLNTTAAGFALLLQ